MIAQGYNQPISSCDPSAHAEITVLREAGQKLKNYRLLNTTLYVTLEPCVMCLGALIHARIKRLVFACADPKAGALTVFNLTRTASFNHQIEITEGVLSEACRQLLQQFFLAKRKN